MKEKILCCNESLLNWFLAEIFQKSIKTMFISIYDILAAEGYCQQCKNNHKPKILHFQMAVSCYSHDRKLV